MPKSGSGGPLVPGPTSPTPPPLAPPGFQDEHGYGGFCHPWESEHHHPWCYVDDGCEGAKRGVKMRKHQACSSQTGYLGPQVRPRWLGDSGGVKVAPDIRIAWLATPHPDH